MRARAALAAALCGFVTVGAVIECQAGVQAVAATVEKIEPSPSRFPECIQVVDFPDNAESMGASAQSCEMFGIKSLIQKDSQMEFSSGTDNAPCLTIHDRIRRSLLRRKFIKTYPDPGNNLISGSLASILGDDMGLNELRNLLVGWKIPNFASLNTDISAQLALRSLVGPPDQVSRRAIQEDSCCTQNERHGRQYDCAERDPKFLMFGKKTIESSEPPWPIISALVFFIVAPALGLVLGCSDRRRMRRLGIGILSAWCLGLLGIGALVGLG